MNYSQNNNLLIVGAGQYGLVALEIAQAMHRFDKIAFLDDSFKESTAFPQRVILSPSTSSGQAPRTAK